METIRRQDRLSRELNEEALLPHPVRVRDMMILRAPHGGQRGARIESGFSKLPDPLLARLRRLRSEILEELAASEAKKA